MFVCLPLEKRIRIDKKLNEVMHNHVEKYVR